MIRASLWIIAGWYVVVFVVSVYVKFFY